MVKNSYRKRVLNNRRNTNVSDQFSNYQNHLKLRVFIFTIKIKLVSSKIIVGKFT